MLVALVHLIHTEPAELILAVTAGHEHAATVLLDGAFALRARLGVDLHPIVRIDLTLIDSIYPHGHPITVHGHVCILRAREAEGLIAAVTLHIYRL